MILELFPGDFILNAQRESVDGEGLIESNFLLRAVKITNTLEAPVQIKALQFDLMAKGKTVKTICYPGEMIKERAEELQELVYVFSRNPDNELFYFGSKVWNYNEFVSDNLLLPGKETGIFLEHFLTFYKESIDYLSVTLKYDLNGVEQVASRAVAVKTHLSTNKYLFPLEGEFLIVNNWNSLYGHRLMGNQEFAIDVVALDKNGQLLMDLENDQYSFYGINVLAASSGKVVEVFDSYPENPKGSEMLTKVKMKELYEKYGYNPIVAGNYVVLEHDNNEYSFYAHLVTGSIPVKVGDKVERGEVIGKLGNSGNSDMPHLHFHVMSGKNLSSRALPFEFANIVNIFGEKITFIDQDFCQIKTVKCKNKTEFLAKL